MLRDVQKAIGTRPAGTRLVVLSDYDGTLAEFHDDPTIPRPSEETTELLGALTHRADLSFGIVSGRRVSDLRTRTQLPSRVYLAGLHGMEIEVGTVRWQHPDLDAARKYVRALSERLEEVRGQVRGLLLEDKDASIAVHVRTVDPAERAHALELADRCAADWVSNSHLRRLTGNMVLEFLPNIACHKGDATRWIAADVQQRCDAPPWVVFIGDDVTDEDAFAAITHGVGVLVGSRPSVAQYQLDSIGDVNALLSWLAREG
ncbi:MAG TPA: trehalose-phosphatase [Vicinamibacterales bacterium]|nr:trehalose-phosphatase [Vicinamibacterales bacterium]